MKRLFVVSDIHGHYTLLKQALDDAGFDENNENHVFVCCGDLFDRGHENRKVYDFVCHLKRKVLIRGNHDERLAEILVERGIHSYDLHNGTHLTIREFFGDDCMDAFGQLSFHAQDTMPDELRDFVNSMLDYFETEHYVFVHGWIPIELEGYRPRIPDNWREADEEAWYESRYLEWPQFYGTAAMLSGKTIVCGHRFTRFAHRYDPSREPDDPSIFYGDGMIAIDAGTVVSGRVNVLVLDEEMDLPQESAGDNR